MTITLPPPVEVAENISPTVGYHAKEIHELTSRGLIEFGSQKLCDAKKVVDLLLDVRKASEELISLIASDDNVRN